MSTVNEVLVGVATAAVAGGLAWLARPLFRRPQQTLGRALAGAPVAVEAQALILEMSDVPPLEGPTSYIFENFDPSDESKMAMGLAEWQRWAYSHGGEDVRTSVVQVTLQGLSDDAISIEAPTLSPHKVTGRPSSRRFGPGGLGGGGVLPRHYTFHINGSDVRRTFDEVGDRPQAFQLGAGETERLIVKVEVEDASRHEWGLRIPYIHRGTREYLEITEAQGRPFVTNGADGLETWFYDGAWFNSRP